MVGRIVIGLTILSSAMLIGGCRYDVFNGCSDVVLVQVKSNGVSVANGLPVDSISSAREIRHMSEPELHAVLIPENGSCVRDIFYVMGLFAAAGAPDFYMRTRFGTLMYVSYSIAEDRTDIVDEGCQVDEFVMDGRRFFAWKDLSELSVERQDWIDYKDEPCTNVYLKASVLLGNARKKQVGNRVAKLFCAGSTSSERCLDFMAAAAENGYKCVFLSSFDQ